MSQAGEPGIGDAPTGAALGAARRWLTAYGVAAVIFAVIDVIWLSVVAQRLYASQIGHLLADEFNLAAAAVFYLVYLVGLVHFAIRPLEAGLPLRRRLTDAALYGLVTYATWDLTSMAVFPDFPLTMVVVDLAWGVSVCVVVTALTTRLLRSRLSAPSAAAT